MFPGFPTRLKTDILNQFASEIQDKKRDKSLKYKVNVIVCPPCVLASE